MPKDYYYERILVEGETLKETFQKNNAKYQIAIKYSNSKLNLLDGGRKRSSSENLPENARISMRLSLDASILGEKKCSWCGEEDDESNLHSAGVYHAPATSK